MKAVALVLGLLLMLGGGAVAGAQYASVDLSALGQAEEFLRSQNALYAGGGGAALGLLLFIVGVLPGGKKAKTAAAPKMTTPMASEAKPAAQPAPEPVAEAPKPTPVVAPQPAAQAAPAPAAPAPSPAPAVEAAPAAPDPRLLTRKRLSDLVTVNDALKAFHAKTGSYPAADGLKGAPDRGADWVPGLAPDYLPELPRDPAGGADNNSPQYLYISDGSGYKLIAHGVSADGSNVEVLGVKIDPARRKENGFWAYGFWTEGFDAI